MAESLFVLTQLCEPLPKGLPIYVVNSFHPFAMKRRKVILGKVLLHAATKGVTERSCQICLENKLLWSPTPPVGKQSASFCPDRHFDHRKSGVAAAQECMWRSFVSSHCFVRACLFSHRGADRWKGGHKSVPVPMLTAELALFQSRRDLSRERCWLWARALPVARSINVQLFLPPRVHCMCIS